MKDNLYLKKKMTPDRIEKVIKKLKEMAATNYSNYAGFHLEGPVKQGYHHCFIVNNQPYHSSNLTLKLEEFSDAVQIISGFRLQTENETLKELEDQGPVSKDREIFLHYLKLLITCQ